MIASLALLMSVATFGQEVPTYSHYFINPYLYNPAFAGSEGKGALFLTHRRQWVGIDGAPVTSNLSYHTPFTRGLNFGLNLNWDERSILNSYNGLLTLGYTIKFSRQVFMRFGISGGARWSSIDLDQVDNPSDPALIGILGNSVSLDGNAGISLHFGTLSLGASLPHIFSTETISSEPFSTGEFFPTDIILFTASYRQYFAQDQFAFEPRFFYSYSEVGDSQWEALATLDLKNIIYLGGAYKQDYGFTALLGLKIRGSLGIGYSFDFGPAAYSGLKNGTHEFQLSLAFGKGRKRLNQKYSFLDMRRSIEPKPEKPLIVETQKDPVVEEPVVETPIEEVPVEEEIVEETQPAVEEQPVQEEETEEQIPEVVQPEIVTPEPDGSGDQPVVVRRGGHLLELPEGHYVINGAFTRLENAQNFSDELFQKGYKASFGFVTEKNLYYVFLFKTDNTQSARAERDRLRQNNLFPNAWYLVVEK